NGGNTNSVYHSFLPMNDSLKVASVLLPPVFNCPWIHQRQDRRRHIRSVQDLDPTLQLARIKLAEDLAESGVVDNASHQVEVRMIECVEELGAKLQAHGFVDPDIARQNDIGIDQAGSNDGVAADIAERPGSRRQEGIGVEESAGALQAVSQMPIGARS